MFQNGVEFDRCFETPAGVVWVSAVVRTDGRSLILQNLLVYPTTGATIAVGAGPMLEIIRFIEQAARLDGYERYTIEAERVHPGKASRIIKFSRRLR
jgi:hypothetical protein